MASRTNSGSGGAGPPQPRTDGFLTKLAQKAFPAATVWCLNEGTAEETWELRRPAEAPVGLGHYFGLARQSVEGLVAAEAAKPKS